MLLLYAASTKSSLANFLVYVAENPVPITTYIKLISAQKTLVILFIVTIQKKKTSLFILTSLHSSREVQSRCVFEF